MQELGRSIPHTAGQQWPNNESHEPFEWLTCKYIRHKSSILHMYLNLYSWMFPVPRVVASCEGMVYRRARSKRVDADDVMRFWKQLCSDQHWIRRRNIALLMCGSQSTNSSMKSICFMRRLKKNPFLTSVCWRDHNGKRNCSSPFLGGLHFRRSCIFSKLYSLEAAIVLRLTTLTGIRHIANIVLPGRAIWTSFVVACCLCLATTGRRTGFDWFSASFYLFYFDDDGIIQSQRVTPPEGSKKFS